MLEAMHPIPALRRVDTHVGLYIDVIVHAFNIGIGMMVDVVLGFPEHGTSSQYIERIGRELIDPFYFGKTLMASFVHDVKSYKGQITS
jgi:hypothetical protein